MAESYSAAGDLEAAQAVYEEALVVNRCAGSRDFVTVDLINLARVAISRGRPDDSARYLAEALATSDMMGSTRKAHGLLNICAGLAAVRGEWERSARLFAITQRLMREKEQHVEPADEAVLAPLLAQTSAALGEVAFAAAQRTGSEMGLNATLDAVRAWLIPAP